ncbi:MAG: glutamate formimidoyltransferase [Candidatus Limnocylindrales bacterium]
MSKLVEAVPNFSEGRRLEAVDKLVAAVESVPGAYLLDRSSDRSHNRTVLTLAGETAPILEALERTVAVAVAEIDMESHAGEHPRIGAVDVVPFVPLAGTTMADCIELARTFGSRVADRFGIPVYLYGEAATSPSRRRLADVRRGQYEGLKTQIGEPGRGPDFGPTRLHAKAGAMAVGARPFLIAYNINLESKDVELARRIARRIRESSGGLPQLQANGFWIEEIGRAQVSMNLLDYRTTPLWLVWEAVRAQAAEDGVHVLESELIGLAPMEAFLDVANHCGISERLPESERLAGAAGFLKLRDFSPLQVLELRLEDARGRRS